MDYESHDTKAKYLAFLKKRRKEKGKEDKPIVHESVLRDVAQFHDSKENLN